MTTREEVLKYGMTFPDVYQDAPFHDPNWILVRYKKNKKLFSGHMNIRGRCGLMSRCSQNGEIFGELLTTLCFPDIIRTKNTGIQ